MIKFKHKLHGDAYLLPNTRFIVKDEVTSIEFRLLTDEDTITRISGIEDAGTTCPLFVYEEYGYLVNTNGIKTAFQDLMGMNGDIYVKEILETKALSLASYKTISDNISFNGKSSIVEHFGLVHWYYLQGLK